MLRFYAVESSPTNTAAKADHRLHMKASEVEGFAARWQRRWARRRANQAGGEFTARRRSLPPRW